MLCPHLIVLPYDATAYETAAHSLWDLFAIESSLVEPVSPEICFFEICETKMWERHYGISPNPQQRVRELAHSLETRVRVPVKVGLARTKLLARQAALHIDNHPGYQIGDQDILTWIPPELEARFLNPIPLEQLFEQLSKLPLDRTLRLHLQKLGIRTAGDIQQLSLSELQQHFGQQGYLLQRLAMGEDDDPVRPLWPPRQITRSIHFEAEVSQIQTVHIALRRCAATLAQTLTRQRSFCRRCVLEIDEANGDRLVSEERMFRPLDKAEMLYQVAIRLLSRLSLRHPILGITLVAKDLGTGSGLQLALPEILEPEILEIEGTTGKTQRMCPHGQNSHLQNTLDYLRQRYGVGSIVVASLLHHVRQLDFWAYPLTRRLNACIEPVQVTTDTRGVPVRFFCRGQQFEVRHVQNRWREVERCYNIESKPITKIAFRLETDPPGLYELHRIGTHWRLGAIFD